MRKLWFERNKSDLAAFRARIAVGVILAMALVIVKVLGDWL